MRSYPTRNVCWFLLALAGLVGCNGLGNVPVSQTQTVETEEELRDRLVEFEGTFEATIRKASDELVSRKPTRRTKRLTLLWQMRIAPMAQEALEQDNPRGALLDLWTLVVRQRQFFTEGDGKDLFGKSQEIAVKTATESEQQVEKIAGLVTPPGILLGAKGRVYEVAKKNPLRGEFLGTPVRVALQTGQQDEVLKSVLTLPLVPFKWLGGVDETAQAIKGFTVVAARLTEVVRGLAADARLQTQLLLLETEDLETIKSVVKSLDRVSQSSAELTKVAQDLPSDVRKELAGALDDIEQRRDKLRKTIDDVERLAAQIETTASKTATAGEAWSGTAKSIQDMVFSFKGIEEENEVPVGATTRPGTTMPTRRTVPIGNEAEEESPPFNINDYRETAESLTVTAIELQKLSENLQGLAKSKELNDRVAELSTQVEGVLAKANTTTEGAINHLTWRGVQLSLLVFALAIVYRIIATWVIARR